MTFAPSPASLHPPQRTVAAFDFDGTLTTSDSLRDFVRHTVGDARFAIAVLRASPWLAGLGLGLCDRADAKARFLGAALGGISKEELQRAAQGYAGAKLLALVRPEMVERVRTHQRLGHTLVLVSASPALYLEPWAAGLGFDAVLATALAFPDGRFSGQLASPNCWGPEKVRRLQQWFGDDRPARLFAYGDSRGDREMLALADHGWLRGQGDMPPLDTQDSGDVRGSPDGNP